MTGAIKQKIKQHMETESVTGCVRKGFSEQVTFEQRLKGGTAGRTESGGQSNIYHITACTIQICVHHTMYSMFSILKRQCFYIIMF